MDKKYIIIENSTDRVLAIGEELDELENGYPRLVKENVAFPPNLVKIIEMPVPSDVEKEYYKYCYNEEDGFFLDPNYSEEPQE